MEDSELRQLDLELYKSYIEYAGYTGGAIEAFNKFMKNELPQLVAARTFKYSTGPNRELDFRFVNMTVENPLIPGTSRPMYPAYAVMNKLTYYGTIYGTAVGMDGLNIVNDEVHMQRKILGIFPMMVRSEGCNLFGKSDKEIYAVGDDPSVPGGYFIIKGQKRLMSHVQKLRSIQMSVVPRRGAFEKSIFSKQIFITDTISSQMKAIKREKEGDILLDIAAFGNKAVKTSGESPYNRINVLHVVKMLDLYYFTSVGEPRLSSPNNPIEKIFIEMMQQYMPKLKTEKSWIQILTEFQSTINFYSQERHEVVMMKVLNWLNVKVSDPRVYGEKIREVMGKIYPTAKRKIFKIRMIANLTVRLLSYTTGNIPATDRNKWGHQKLDTASDEFIKQFRIHFGLSIRNLSAEFQKGTSTNVHEIASRYDRKTVDAGMMVPFEPVKTQAGDIKPFVLTEAFDTNNLARKLSLLNKIHVKRVARNSSAHRDVVSSQAYWVCPVSTPEGSDCGLTKFLSSTPVKTYNVDPGHIIRLLTSLKYFTSHWIENEMTYPIFVNGIPIGFCAGKETKDKIVRLKRPDGICSIHEHTCVVFTEIGHLEIYTDAGRLVRPVAIVENGKLLIDTTNSRGLPFAELLKRGVVAYIDTYEEEFEFMAHSSSDLAYKNHEYEIAKINLVNREASLENENLNPNARERLISEIKIFNDILDMYDRNVINYCNLHPISMYEASVSFLPYGEHIPPARLSYSIKYLGQAISPIVNPLEHISGKFSKSAARGFAETGLESLYGVSNRPFGNNVLIGIMNTESNQEDALSVSQNIIDMGVYDYIRRYVIQTIVKSGKHRLGIPKINAGEDPHIYDHLGNDGLPAIGTEIGKSQVVIGKINIADDSSVSVKTGPDERGIVVDIIKRKVSSNKGQRDDILISVLIEKFKHPKRGDKFFVLGQKQTFGRVYQKVDMPTIISGENAEQTISILYNPHVIASRMTVGMLFEPLVGKKVSIDGIPQYATTFGDRKDILNIISKVMEENGFEDKGLSQVQDGITGEILETRIYSGTINLMQLHHMAEEKGQARNTGANNLKTCQPVKGRKHEQGGGMRFGEMDITAALSHGACSFVVERQRDLSDPATLHLCKLCRKEISNSAVEACPFCGSKLGYLTVDTTEFFKQFMQSVLVLGCNIKLNTIDNEAYLRDISKSYEMDKVPSFVYNRDYDSISLEDSEEEEIPENIYPDESDSSYDYE